MWGVRDTIKAANAGMDIEMPMTNKFGKKLLKAVNKGHVSIDTINESAFRIINTILQFNPNENQEIDQSVIASPAHTQLALEAAEKSMVLLKNNQILPLKLKTIKNVAVFGKLANVENVGDHGSSWVRPKYTITPLQGIQHYVGNQAEIIYDHGKNLSRAQEKAIEADVAIIVVGNTHKDEGEYMSDRLNIGGDRTSLKLHEDEIDLINSVATVNQKTIVIIVAGSAITVEDWHENVPGIIMSWYAGMEGGTALAKILFGEVNPSGKMPFLTPIKEENLPFFDPNAEVITYEYYHGYTLFDKEDFEARYPFGYGLSYTTFQYKNLEILHKPKDIEDHLEVQVDIKNIGDIDGTEIVQHYIGYQNPSVERHQKDLKEFARIHLSQQEVKTITFRIPAKNLRYYSPQEKKWVLDPITYKVFIGPSSDETQCLSTQFSITHSES